MELKGNTKNWLKNVKMWDQKKGQKGKKKKRKTASPTFLLNIIQKKDKDCFDCYFLLSLLLRIFVECLLLCDSLVISTRNPNI